MQIGLLGPLAVTDQSVPIAIPGEKLRAVIATLALTPGVTVSSFDLLDELWGERLPRSAANSLQGHIARLRRTLVQHSGKEEMRQVIRTSGPGYLLAVPPESIDASRFVADVERAGRMSAREPEKTIVLLTEALATWRGPALLDTGHGMICRTAAARLEETRLLARELLIDAKLALGGHYEVVSELEQLLSRHPLRERLCEQLMIALYRSGRQADALGTYHRLRQRLSAELGLEPGPGLQGTLAEILRHGADLLHEAS
ncbi:AfsR/SARP family transcriptional regulator [Streptomyces durbertensis]|uniref:AfsR/SARP family transcriptional regulator n=1 Tax=Streptomyces durbertensis TaxID=2448886 RepID=A0ABR6EIL4_9ACTN|nr:BTAD domain-containing putative transcriptional regulator [Streptomyces durbertensis]MBB1245176.1 AfsR/SARP family transcriptional regulator [Streptomyces durbertensis]